MEYTKGEWEVTKSRPLDNWVVEVNGNDTMNRIRIAQCYDNKYDANLIVAAVNACIKINPANPLAVAESIGTMYRMINKDDFITTESPSTVTVRWKHNNRVCKTLRGSDAKRRAQKFIDFLVGHYDSEGFKLIEVSEGHCIVKKF